MDRVSGIRVKAVRERQRRVLSLADLAKLIQATSVVDWWTAIVYKVTLAAALRAGEVRHVQIDGCHLRLPKQPGTKHYKGAWIRLPAPLAGEASLVDWTCVPTGNLARDLRKHLKLAGIPYETPEGIFDFHALRHQSGALLVSHGVSIKAVQAHMRHSSIRLTLDTYGHLMDTDKRAASAAVDAFCQRVAQRDVVDSVPCGTDGSKPLLGTPKQQWSDGESNPDLLNAIQTPRLVMSLVDGGLRDKQGREVAPRAAQRLLARTAGRLLQQRGRGRK